MRLKAQHALSHWFDRWRKGQSRRVRELGGVAESELHSHDLWVVSLLFFRPHRSVIEAHADGSDRVQGLWETKGQSETLAHVLNL